MNSVCSSLPEIERQINALADSSNPIQEPPIDEFLASLFAGPPAKWFYIHCVPVIGRSILARRKRRFLKKMGRRQFGKRFYCPR